MFHVFITSKTKIHCEDFKIKEIIKHSKYSWNLWWYGHSAHCVLPGTYYWSPKRADQKLIFHLIDFRDDRVNPAHLYTLQTSCCYFGNILQFLVSSALANAAAVSSRLDYRFLTYSDSFTYMCLYDVQISISSDDVYCNIMFTSTIALVILYVCLSVCICLL